MSGVVNTFKFTNTLSQTFQKFSPFLFPAKSQSLEQKAKLIVIPLVFHIVHLPDFQKNNARIYELSLKKQRKQLASSCADQVSDNLACFLDSKFWMK